MALSGRAYRAFAAPRDGLVKVHLGPGQSNHLAGWINVDANAFSGKSRPEVWANLRHTLPFHDGTVDIFYSHHVIEHLPDSDLPRHLADMFRCLKPGGMIRIGGPNGDEAARQFLNGNAEWFSDFPDRRTSVGGRFANFILCRGEHLTILSRSYLEELLSNAGYVDIRPCQPTWETTRSDLVDSAVLKLESESTPEAPHTLILEARKPG
ncbi:MAG: methyltransferase domain-containing protein [Myxococcales bacterium]